MNSRKLAVLSLGLVLVVSLLPSVFANNLSISNVRLTDRNPSSKTVAVLFDISWENSWRNKINHDAAWVTLRLTGNDPSAGKSLCSLSAAGITPQGFSAGTNAAAELYVPGDKTGVFVRRSGHGLTSAFSSNNVRVNIDYSSCGFDGTSEISATLLGLEMVLVPEGGFYAGDFSASQASFRQGAADTTPLHVTSAGPFTVPYYVSAGNNGEVPTGNAVVLPQGFPTGYGAFYAMKYEITEGQWVEFINSIPAGARVHHDITDSLHKNADSVLARNTVACSGATLVCTTQRPSRAMTYLSWSDLTAFLDWAALRPMTELEFEKMARGPGISLANEYAWGTASITPALQLTSSAADGTENGTESVVTPSANANFGAPLLTGGDQSLGIEHQQGALRGGIFSTGDSIRLASGAGYYGIMELSGNVKERVVSTGRPEALSFTATNGDGYLTTLSGFEGNANVAGWPGMGLNPAQGVITGGGSGFRGGSWADSAARLQISDRTEAALGANTASSASGGRGVRTVDGQ